VSETNEQELVFNLQCLQRRTARKRFRKDILEAWENTCAYCGSDRAHTLDHVVPRAKGGPTKRGNLLACCPTCNLQKSDVDWLLWFRSQSFWSIERETAIWTWLSYNHESSIAAREYEEACREPLKLPAPLEDAEESALSETCDNTG
jgi:hypothetical protein